MAQQIYTRVNELNTTLKLKEMERFPFLLISFSFSLDSPQHLKRGINNYNQNGERFIGQMFPRFV